MPRPRCTPKYRFHKQSGQGIVTLTDPLTGFRKDVLLGKYNTKGSKEMYHRLLAEWEAAGQQIVQAAPKDATVNDVALAYVRFATGQYKPTETGSCSEVENIKQAVKLLREAFGTSPAAQFGPKRLRAVRDAMVRRDWCRSYCNRQVNRLRRLFKWASGEELIPASVYHGLCALEPLRKGTPGVREQAPVKPVPVATVEATKPFMASAVAAMVDLQLLTGMRPGEVCTMRTSDLETTGRIWIYRPATHKTAHHGHAREIPIGPKAQAVVKPWLRTELAAFLFSPAEAMQEFNAKRREDRKTRLWPSHLQIQAKKLKRRRKQEPSDHYITSSYARAILYACDHAFPPPDPLAQREKETKKEWLARLTPEQKEELKAWHRQHHWHPNRLRHTHATQVRKQFGLEAAQVALGHSNADVTQVYAEANRELAAKVAAEIG